MLPTQWQLSKKAEWRRKSMMNWTLWKIMVQALLCFHFYFLIKLQPQNDTESNSEVARQPLPKKILNEIEHIKCRTLKSGKHEGWLPSITDPTAPLWDENDDPRGSVEMYSVSWWCLLTTSLKKANKWSQQKILMGGLMETLRILFVNLV